MRTASPRSSLISPAASGARCSFPREAHLEPRRALPGLAEALAKRGVAIRLGVDRAVDRDGGDFTIDCRGLAARDVLPDLRGVRGEMVVIRSREVSLSRPVRLLHPRIPLYIVPRGEGVFMVGATMIESEARGGVSVRSAVELLNAAYALHPAFGEAEILELGADLRPAFPDNLPAVRHGPNGLLVNGLYRHGFLLAPAMARGRGGGSIAWRVTMRIFVNGDPREIEPATLALALTALGLRRQEGRDGGERPLRAGAGARGDGAQRRRQARGRGADAGRLTGRSTASIFPRACCSARRAIPRPRCWPTRSRRRAPRSSRCRCAARAGAERAGQSFWSIIRALGVRVLPNTAGCHRSRRR